MARWAQLPSGQYLEFPDDTADEVIQRTVKKSLGVAAPEEEKETHISGEPGTLGYAVQGAGAGIETLARGMGFLGGTVAGGIAGAVSAPFVGTDKAVDIVRKGQELGTDLGFFPKRVFAPSPMFEEAMGEGFQKVIDVGSDIGARDLQWDPNAPEGSIRANPLHEAKAKSLYSAGIEAALLSSPFARRGGKPTGKGVKSWAERRNARRMEKLQKDIAAKEAASKQAAKESGTIPEQLEFQFEQQVPMAGGKGGGILREGDLAKGPGTEGIPYNRALSEQIARDVSGPDLFRTPEPPVGTTLEARPSRTVPGQIPYEKIPPPRINPVFEKTPKAQPEGIQYKQEVYSDPVNRGIQRQEFLDANKNKYIPRKKAEALQQEARSKQENRAEVVEQAIREKEFLDANVNKYVTERQKADMAAARASEIQALAEKGNPIIDPVQSVPAGKPKFIPKGQRGAVNPEVFQEGFRKIKDLANGLKLLTRFDKSEGYPTLKATIYNPQNNGIVSEAIFVPTARGAAEIASGNLYSVGTATTPKFRGRGYATEIYKAVSELGNDIVKSDFLTQSKKQSGTSMWKAFEEQGLASPEGKFMPPSKQRGAINWKEIKEGLGDIHYKLMKPVYRKTIAKEEAKLKAANRSERSIIDEKIDPVPWDKHSIETKGVKELPSNFTAALDISKPSPTIGESIQNFGKRAAAKTRATYTSLVATLADPASLHRVTLNPHVKWLHERVLEIDSSVALWADLMKEQVRFQAGKRGFTKIVDPDSVLGRLPHMSIRMKNQAATIMNRFFDRTSGAPNKEALLKEGFSTPAVDYIMKVGQVMNRIWNDIDATIVKAQEMGIPIKRMNKYEGYFPPWYGEGNHIVRLRAVNAKPGDASLWFRRTKSRAQAERLAAEMSQELKAKGIESKPEFSYETAGAGRDFNLPLSVVNDLVAHLERGDPRGAVIKQAWADIQSRARAGGHTARRKGVSGGELTGKDLKKSFERYVDQMTAYKRNLELKMVEHEIFNSKTNSPRDTAIGEWMQNYIDSLKGGDRALSKVEQWLDQHVMENFSTKLSPAVRLSNKLALNSFLIMLNPKFGIASWSQSTQMSHGVMKLWKSLDPRITGSPSRALANAYLDALYKEFRTPDQQAFLEFQAYRGYTDPMFTHALSDFTSKTVNKFVDYVGLGFFPKSGERFGRTHSSLAAYNLLRESGFTGKELWQESIRMSREIMADYTRVGKIGLVRNTGLLGEAIAPLTTFYNWWLNMNAVMLERAALHGNIAPVASMVAMGAIFAGVLGMPFFEEINKIYSLLKDPKAPNLKQMLVENAPDWVVFGLIDGLLTKAIDPRGIRLSGSMMSPSIHLPGESFPTQPVWENMFPGVAHSFRTIEGMITLLTTDQTAADRKRAWQDVVPGNMLDRFFQNMDESGNLIGWDQPGLTQAGQAGLGGVRRSDPFETTASILGSGTLQEQRENIGYREQYEQELSITEKQNQVVELIVDRIRQGQFQGEEATRLVTEAVKLGIPYDRLMNRIQEHLMGRMQTRTERGFGRGTTPEQAERFMQHQRRQQAGGY